MGAEAEAESAEVGDDGEAQSTENTEMEQKDVEEAEEETEAESAEVVSVLSALRSTVAARHSSITQQFLVFAEKEKEADAAESSAVDESFGAEDARKEALDANKESVRKVREAFEGNNGEWRELLMAVSTDYARMEGQRQSLVEGIADSQRELKAFIDLVVKIPKRKILNVQEDNEDVENGDAEEVEEENVQEAVEDGDEQQEDGDEERQEAEDDGDADGDDGDGDDE